MKSIENSSRIGWYAFACVLAVFTYFYGLGSEHIPKNGDEYVYAHITRITAASGELLPLRSELKHMRNTKPPLLMWQGIASTEWAKNWSLWDLRYPSVIYTLLTAALLFMLGRKLSGDVETGFIAALTWLAFFTTYRYGRPFLTNPPEVFWLFLPFFVLLYWRDAFESRLLIPLLLGISIGIGFLYKSFALGLPLTLALSGWYLYRRHYRLAECLTQDAFKVATIIAVAVGIFALWFVFDPDPQSVWKEFVVGENVGKFDPHGPSYIEKLLWGGSSLWSYTFAFLTNPGLLTFPVVVLCFVLYKRRHELGDNEKLLVILFAAFFFSFALPSQRSGRYLLDVMPAVALLCALNWQRIARWSFVASLVLAFFFLCGLAWLAYRLQTEVPGLYGALFWLIVAATAGLTIAAIVWPALTRMATNIVALLVLVCFTAFVRPFGGTIGKYDSTALQYAQGKEIGVPCNFRAMQEGNRFILPGADIHGYHDDLKLTVQQLAERYPVFALRLPLDEQDLTGGCAGCKVIGSRLDIRGRIELDEVKEMILQGRVYNNLFVREVLIESPPGPKVMPELPFEMVCG